MPMITTDRGPQQGSRRDDRLPAVGEPVAPPRPTRRRRAAPPPRNSARHRERAGEPTPDTNTVSGHRGEHGEEHRREPARRAPGRPCDARAPGRAARPTGHPSGRPGEAPRPGASARRTSCRRPRTRRARARSSLPHAGHGQVGAAAVGPRSAPPPPRSAITCAATLDGSPTGAAGSGSGSGSTSERKHCPHHSASALASAPQSGHRRSAPVGSGLHAARVPPAWPPSANEARDAQRAAVLQPHHEPSGDRGPRVVAEHARAARLPHRPGPVGVRRAGRRRPSRPRRTSAPSTRMPVSPSTSASRAPPESPTTTGFPHAAASMNTLPQPSTSIPASRVRHGIANTSPSA